MSLIVIGSILLAVSLVFGLVIIVNAFKESAGQGVLCLVVPFYMFYWALARYASPKKGLVLSGWLGAAAVAAVLLAIGVPMALGDAARSIDRELATGGFARPSAAAPVALPPSSVPAPATPQAPTRAAFTCNAVQRNHVCFTLTPLPMFVTGSRTGCEVGSGGQWSEGASCPSEQVVGTCRKELNNEVRSFYRGANLAQAQTACTAFGGTWQPAP